MVLYILRVYLHSSEIAGKHVFFLTWELEPHGKSSMFPLWKLDSCSLKPARKTIWFISLLITTTNLDKYLSFLKERGWVPFLLGCHLTVRSHLIRVAAGVVVNTYKTLSLDLFSHGTVLCVPGVVFPALKLQGNVCEPGNWGLMVKQYYPPVKAGELQPQSCQKNTLIDFPLQQELWSSFEFLSFLKETVYLALLAGKSFDSTVSSYLGNNYGSQHLQNTLL